MTSASGLPPGHFFKRQEDQPPRACPPPQRFLGVGWGGADLRLRWLVSDASLSSISATGRGRPQTLGWYPRYPRDTHCSSDISHRLSVGSKCLDVLDLRGLNRFLKVLPFRMLRMADVLQSVAQGAWFVSVDLKDAYFHVPIPPHHRQFLPAEKLWRRMPLY